MAIRGQEADLIRRARAPDLNGIRGAFYEWETLQDLLQVHHLPRDELRDREPNDVDNLAYVGDDASDLCTGQAVGFGAETEHDFVAVDFVAVDRVDVEMDGDPRAAGTGEPLQECGARLPQLVRAEGLKTPLGQVRIVVVGPGVQSDEDYPVRCNGRGKQGLHPRVTVSSER